MFWFMIITITILKNVVGRSSFTTSSAASIASPNKNIDPYDEMANFLSRSWQYEISRKRNNDRDEDKKKKKNGKSLKQRTKQHAADNDDDNDIDLSVYKSKEISKALSTLANGQSALKSLDGVTHQFRNTFRDSSSLSARHQKFMGGPKKTKEASKLLEYVTIVERGLQSTEILSAIRIQDESERSNRLHEAGLVEIKRVSITRNKLQCILSIMLPVSETSLNQKDKEGENGEEDNGEKDKEGENGEEDNDDDENIITSKKRETRKRFRSNLSKNKKKKNLIRENDLRFQSNEMIIGFVDVADTNTDVAQILRVMSQKEEYISLSSVGLVQEEVTVQPTLLEIATDALIEIAPFILQNRNNSSNELVESIENSNSISISNSSSKIIDATQNISIHGGNSIPNSIRIVGYSAGGAVAAYVAMILDGSLNSTASSLSKVQNCCGAFSKRVNCLSIGPPPCLSRTIVPRFISSIICGDDVIPRASSNSISNIKQRTYKALKAGAGSSASLNWMTSGWITDLTAVASRGLEQYTGSSHDLSSLHVPGRAFFIKARKHKQGASIQRVLRGNWQEDMLWLLHEILLSKRMIEHHSLESHFRTLSRM